MYAKDCTIFDLEEALRRVNEKYNRQVCWNRVPNKTNKGIHFTLKVKTNRSEGHSISQLGRHISSACWHVHGDFFDCLFEVEPEARVFALGREITKHYGNWQDFNRGSLMNPKYASEMCECGRG